MLSKKEKSAIELLKTYENKLVYEIEDKDKKAVKVLLNLITKLQEENEYWKNRIEKGKKNVQGLKMYEMGIVCEDLKEEIKEKDKQIEQYLNKRIADVEKCYNEMLTDIGGIKIINITGLSKKEKEEVINKRNCLLVQKQCYQEILEKLSKENK